MDPLSALSVAGTVVQFVDFCFKLFSHSKELYQSATGRLTADEELVLVTTDLKAVVIRIQRAAFPNQSDTSRCLEGEEEAHQNTLGQICNNTSKVAGELLAKLDKLKLDASDRKYRRWKTLRQAVNTLWSKEEIDGLRTRLSTLKEALQTRVLFAILGNLDAQSIRLSSRIDSLDEQTQQILTCLLNNHQVFSQNITSTISISIAQMLCRMDALNRDEHSRTRDMIVAMQRDKNKESVDHAGIDQISGITAAIEMVEVSGDSERHLRKTVDHAILDGLRYVGMSDRYEAVVEPHPTTFDWAFEDSKSEQLPWDNLSVWLKTGRGVYWVSGKPGSGKSTLMKHIYDDRRTRSYLRNWADNQATREAPLCVASFFFWNSGTAEQRSQVGMLRSLLFQVLKQQPDLIPIIFPLLWATHYSSNVNKDGLTWVGDWSIKNLMASFKLLLAQTQVPINLCLLIDGLDEFEGDHEELADIFSELAESGISNVKVCLSSRPWAVFKDSFRDCPSLQLHNLTFHDIELFVSDKFHSNSAFERLAKRDHQSATALITNIVKKADGVFLWVRIVVKDILRGIRNLDNFSLLWARLNTLPKDLEPLFAHLISKIEPIYLIWASKAFQITRTARELGLFPRPKLLYRNHSPEEGDVNSNLPSSRPRLRTELSEDFEPNKPQTNGNGFITVSELYLALDEDLEYNDVLDMALSPENLIKKCVQTEAHLAVRCALLLEVGVSQTNPQIGPKCPVQYLHRTARDFLEEEHRWKWLLSCTEGSNFDPYVALMWSHNFNIQRISALDPISEERFTLNERVTLNDFRLTGLKKPTLEGIVPKAIVTATYADAHSKSRRAQSHILESINMAMASISSFGPLWYKILKYDIIETGLVTSFLDLALFFNLSSYVAMKTAKAKATSSMTPEDATLALARRVMAPLDWGYKHMPDVSLEMVAMLVGHGADVNWHSKDEPYHTIWTQFVLNHKSRNGSPYFAILSLLLSSGADPLASGYNSHGELVSIRDFIVHSVVPRFPVEAPKFLLELDLAASHNRGK